MNHSEHSNFDVRVRQPSVTRLGIGLVLFVLLFQFWSRYLPSPSAVFVVDDWSNWARSSIYASYAEAFLTGLQDPNRPLSNAVINTVFRWCGNDPRCWTIISLVGNSLLLMFLMRMAWGLTGRRDVTLLAGILFALFPNLTETYHWSTQVLNEVSCALVFYALSGWMWIEYTQRNGWWRLVIAALTFAVALFSYEAGILLPAAYVTLLPWRRAPWKSVFRLSPFGLVVLFYAAWRATNAFGMNQSWYYPPHMEAGISIGGVFWNLRQLVHGWVGDHMIGCVLNGLQAFATLPSGMKRTLLLGNALVVVVCGWMIARVMIMQPIQPDAITTKKSIYFALAWIGAALVIPLVSYTAPRLNVLPAVGISLFVAMVLARLPVRGWGLVLLVPAVLALTANQGTSESYRQAGVINNKIYAHLKNTAEEWNDKDVILLDTRSLRHRMTRGILNPVDNDQQTWAQNGNALLIRGFAIRGMVQLVLNEPSPAIQTLHDMENGTMQDQVNLYWHERYDPGQPRSTPLSRVYAIDAGLLIWGE